MAEQAELEGTSRASSTRRSMSDTTLPREYLDKLEQKRRQLDDSIHKYIAQKEREYKTYSKELKQQHKLSQGQDGQKGSVNRDSPLESDHPEGQDAVLRAQQISPADALLFSSGQQESREAAIKTENESAGSPDRTVEEERNDRRASVEREKDFLGLFMPDYIPALNATGTPPLQRSSSAPYRARSASNASNTSLFDRANSDSAIRAKAVRPAHLAAMQRTSSSGSSADGKLTSALKSSSQRHRPKRVSLAVGDSIVAPSDSVPTALSHSTTSSHARKRSSGPEREFPISMKKPAATEESGQPTIDSTLHKDQDANQMNAPIEMTKEALITPPTAQISSPTSSPRPVPNPVTIDPDGDLFDLEDEGEIPPPPGNDDEDLDDNIEDDDGVVGRVAPGRHFGEASDLEDRRYDPTTGLIPEPANKDEDSAVPYLAFGSSSAVAPTKPGFRRPSVIDDPVFMGADYKAAERRAVENEIYGSSFNRPGSKNSFTAGSLGESYMAKHAEEMMKLRNARQNEQVKS